MAGSDPKAQLREAVGEIRNALHSLRESVVTALMRRNRAADAAAKLEQQASDLEARAAVAERLNNLTLAAEIREQARAVIIDRDAARRELARLQAAADAAKIALPEEEARLLQQAQDLQSRLVAMSAETLSDALDPSLPSDTDILLERAANRTRELQNEASARAEIAASRTGTPERPLPALRNSSPEALDTQAERLLAELEGQNAAAVLLGGPTIDQQIAQLTTVSDRPAQVEQSLPATARAVTSMAPQRQGERSGMEPNQRVRIAAIGTGSIFRGAHLPVYPDLAKAHLVAFCDPDPTAQRAVLKRYHELMEARLKKAQDEGDKAAAERIERDRDGIQVFEDISQVIEQVKPDLVDICTQPVLHAPLSIQALEAGINVMCEKPISRSWLESLRVIDAVKRTGKLYQHNENWLFDPDWYTAKKLVDAGSIGEPILMFLATAHGGPEGAGKFWNSDFGGGGALLDNGIHAIGASWYVSGFDKRPTYVKAAAPFGMSTRMPNRILDGRFQKVRVDDDAHILIRFENPETLAWTTAHVEGSWSHRDSPDTAVIGTTGRIIFETVENRRYAVVMDAYDRESRRIEVSGPTWQYWPSSFYGEIQNMVESVLSSTPSIMDAAFGSECSAIVGASYLSERDGRRAVAVEEFKQFAHGIAAQYPNSPKAADDALVDALLSAVRK